MDFKKFVDNCVREYNFHVNRKKKIDEMVHINCINDLQQKFAFSISDNIRKNNNNNFCVLPDTVDKRVAESKSFFFKEIHV